MDIDSVLKGHGIGTENGKNYLPLFGRGKDGVINTTGNLTLTSILNDDVIIQELTGLTVNVGHVITV